MIRMVVALPAEARPLVAHFGLERLSQADPLAIYHRPDMALIVSGAGSDAAAAAVDDLLQNTAPGSPSAWLNIGVAGHRSLDVGTVVLGREVVAAERSRALTLEPPELSCDTATIRTVDRIELGFEGDFVYEMEAFGFCSRALEASESQLIQVLKIISDNLETGAGYVSARTVQSLIEASIPLIDRLVYEQNRRSRRLAAESGTRSDPERS